MRRKTQVFSQFFSKSLYQCQVNSRLVTILTGRVFFEICLMNLVDRDLTEHQITQTLTLSRLHAQLEQTRGIRLFNHTQHVDWSRQGESDCLIKQVILRLLTSVQCSAIRANPWSDFMEWIQTNTAWLRSTYRRCFSCWNLVWM